MKILLLSLINILEKFVYWKGRVLMEAVIYIPKKDFESWKNYSKAVVISIESIDNDTRLKITYKRKE